MSKEKEVLALVIEKCWKDPAFKEELLRSNDPIALLEQVSGVRIELPEGTSMQVVDQTNSKVVYFNIPSEPEIPDIELDEHELEMVSGGRINELRQHLSDKPRFCCIKPINDGTPILPPNYGDSRFVR